MSYIEIKPSVIDAADFSKFAGDVLVASFNQWQESVILLTHWINNPEPNWEFSPSYISLLDYVSRSELLLQHFAKVLFANKKDYDTWEAYQGRMRVVDGKVTKPQPFEEVA